MRTRLVTLAPLVSTGIVAGVLTQPLTAQPSCAELAGLTLPHTTITSARLVPAGTVPFGGDLPPIPAPARCVVQAVARPTSDSHITIEVWLPTAGWNGRYQQVGNGGWAGAVPAAGLAAALQRGYAAAGTDGGHSGGTDAAWAIGHPEKLIDFGWRALRETTVTARAVVRAFYGRDASRSYFVGCSDGGREALMEAQRFPEDFDGILAGAPAADWSHLVTGFVWNTQALTSTPASAIPPAKLPAIQQAALAACDTLDGVRDGLVEDPRRCRFDPAVLTCPTGDRPTCLTPPQVAALTKIYAGPRHPRTGTPIAPGFAPGTEASPLGWAPWIIADQPERTVQFAFGTSHYAQAVFENPAWNVRTLNFDTDVALGDAKVGVVLNATNPDLRSFRAHGGKLIQYHGWGDPAIPPLSSIAYYESVLAFFATYPDPRATASGHVSDFYRLFMVPGLWHCGGGAGPSSFGQPGPGTASAPNDPDRDILAALVRWVEAGVTPKRLIGEGTVPGDPSTRLTRPICPYPLVARYAGTGNVNDAARFACAAP